MGRFVEGEDRSQSTLLPERVDDCATEDNPARVVDIFVDHVDLTTPGFDLARPLTSNNKTKSVSQDSVTVPEGTFARRRTRRANSSKGQSIQ